MTEKTFWTTREAANYLGLSTVAMLGKAKILEAVLTRGGYRWPIEKVKAYGQWVAGKAMNDPTRNSGFDG